MTLVDTVQLDVQSNKKAPKFASLGGSDPPCSWYHVYCGDEVVIVDIQTEPTETDDEPLGVTRYKLCAYRPQTRVRCTENRQGFLFHAFF